MPRILSEYHLEEVLKMLEWFRTLGQGQSTVPGESGKPTSASTIVAKVPASGIPALEIGSPDVPGVAQCDIYTISATTTGTSGEAELESMNVTEFVYNLSTSRITSRYALVHRLKAGDIDGYVVVSAQTDEDTGTGTLPICITSLGGVSFSTLDVSSNVVYVLGIDSNGCLIRVPVSTC